MAWGREADKRLSEAVTVLYTDACMRHLPRWVFEGIIIFCTISRMFCVYVFWRHVDSFNVCNRPCFDLFWYHWLFCIGLWWPVAYFCDVRLSLLAPSPGAGESDPPEWSGSKAQTKPRMDQSMAMSINCNLMIELYIRYYVYLCEALVTWFCKMCCIYMLWLIINIFWILISIWIGLDNGLARNNWQAIIWTNADPIHWRIYAALGGDELTCWLQKKVAITTKSECQLFFSKYNFIMCPIIDIKQ